MFKSSLTPLKQEEFLSKKFEELLKLAVVNADKYPEL